MTSYIAFIQNIKTFHKKVTKFLFRLQLAEDLLSALLLATKSVYVTACASRETRSFKRILCQVFLADSSDYITAVRCLWLVGTALLLLTTVLTFLLNCQAFSSVRSVTAVSGCAFMAGKQRQCRH